MKKITFLAIFLISWLLPTFTMAQLTISPVHDDTKAICPGEYTYTLGNKGGESCVYTMTAFDQNNAKIETSDNGKLTVTWDDRPGKVSIKAENKATNASTCTVPKTFNMIIHSVTGLSPKIEGCKDLVIGKKVPHQLRANLAYELGVNKGSSDAFIECKEYEWKLSDDTNPGWSIKTFSSGIDTKNKFCDVTTDVANDGTVMVRGKNHCDKWSDWAECKIKRFVESPCPIKGAPSYVLCEDKKTIFALYVRKL